LLTRNKDLYNTNTVQKGTYRDWSLRDIIFNPLDTSSRT
jgi:hypothetical protein